MALANLFGWMKAADKPATAACGTACWAGEKPEECLDIHNKYLIFI